MSFNYARGGRAPAGPRAALLSGLVLLGLAVPLAAKAADLVAAAAEDGRFATFVRALKAGDAADVLSDEAGPFTVLAPTDKAFEKLPEALLDNLMLPANEAALERVLGLHIVRGTAYAANNLPVNLQTIGGERLAVTFTDGALTVRQAAPEDAGEPSPTIESREGAEARIAFGDVEADNGVIHGLDTVLLPADLGRLETAGEAARAAKAENGGARAAENEGSSPAAAEAEPPPPEPAANGADVTVTTYPPEGGGESAAPEPSLTPLPDANVTVTTVPSGATPSPDDAGSGDRTGTTTSEDNRAPPSEPAEATGTSPPEEDVTVATVPPAAGEGAANEAAENPAAGAKNPAAGAAVDLTSPLVPVSELIGRTVRGEDGEEIGEVEDVLVSLQTARVERFVLGIDDGFFGLKKRPVNVDVGEVSVDPVDGAVVVDPAVVAK